MNISSSLISEAASCYKEKQNSYFFMNNYHKERNKFAADIIASNNINISADNISIASNGTSAIFISILSIKHKHNISNVLLISPTYFTNINVIELLRMNLHYHQVDIFGDKKFGFDEIRKNIINNKIDLIIITDPLFGMGLSISKTDYDSIINIANEFGIWIIIDYIYGGMEWNLPVNVVNGYLIENVVNYQKIIIIESISKRLFLNGIKFSIIYSNANIICTIEELSESFIGSSSYVQNELFTQIYEPSNVPVVIEQIKKNIEFTKQTFCNVKSALLGTDAFLTSCDSGYFALLGIPIHRLNKLSGNKAAVAILDRVNILTIPHSRYLFKDKRYYFFRINLSMNRELLLLNINKLSDSYLY